MGMKKEDYDVINEYFNDLALRLFESKDYECNYLNFIVLNTIFLRYFRERYFENNGYQIEPKKNKLTFQDVIDLARKVIESINPKYLLKYDELLDSGTIDFGYENEYEDSSVSSVLNNGEVKLQLINISRDFNYTDVEVLVHEFMHYLNVLGGSIKDKIIGEFISIYFETYAIEYLYKNYKMNLEEIFYNKRLLNIYTQLSQMEQIQIPFFLFQTYGNLDENSYIEADKFFKNYRKEHYNYDCKYVLKMITDIKREKIGKFEIDEDHYYSLASFLAMYFRKTSDLKTMVNFVDNVNNRENKDFDFITLLSNYNLNIKEDFYKKIKESLDEYLDIFEKENKQR